MDKPQRSITSFQRCGRCNKPIIGRQSILCKLCQTTERYAAATPHLATVETQVEVRRPIPKPLFSGAFWQKNRRTTTGNSNKLIRDSIKHTRSSAICDNTQVVTQNLPNDLILDTEPQEVGGNNRQKTENSLSHCAAPLTVSNVRGYKALQSYDVVELAVRELAIPPYMLQASSPSTFEGQFGPLPTKTELSLSGFLLRRAQREAKAVRRSHFRNPHQTRDRTRRVTFVASSFEEGCERDAASQLFGLPPMKPSCVQGQLVFVDAINGSRAGQQTANNVWRII